MTKADALGPWVEAVARLHAACGALFDRTVIAAEVRGQVT